MYELYFVGRFVHLETRSLNGLEGARLKMGPGVGIVSLQIMLVQFWFTNYCNIAK